MATHQHIASPRRSDFGKDSGLQARMLLTMFLLGLVYVVFVGALVVAGAGAGIIVAVAVVLLLLQLFTSDKLAMATMGVKEVSPAEEPELHGIVERLCVQANLPKSRVCVMETPMPNAFAMGRSRKSTTVCATRGILEMLSPAELEGVMAHELTHVINRDVIVMTLASFFASLAALILQFSFFFGGGGELAVAGERPQQQEGDRVYDHRGDHHQEQVFLLFAVAAAPEEERELQDQRRQRGEEAGQCHHDHVAVDHVRELVRHHAFQLRR